MKRIAKRTTMLLSLALVMNCLTFYSVGDVILPDDEVTASEMEFEIFDEPVVREEIVEWREEGVRHYYLGDGMYQAVVFADVDDGNVASPATTTPNSPSVVDTYISSTQPTGNFGSSTTLPISDTQIAYIYCAMPELPDNAYIDNAKLYFYFTNNNTSGYLSLGAYPIEYAWNEIILTWNGTLGYENNGIGTECLGTVSLYGPTPTTRGNVTITNAVKMWYETQGASNYGIALKRRSGTNSSVTLYSRESGSATAPYIVINYVLGYTIEEGEYYVQNAIELDKLQNESHWSCLMQSSSSSDGTNLFCKMLSMDGNVDQKWTFEFLNNGYYKISNSENLVLSVRSGNETATNATLTLETFTGDDRQQWRIIETTRGTYKLKAKSSDENPIDLAMGTSSTVYLYNQTVKQVVYNSSDSDLNDEWHLHKAGSQAFIMSLKNAGINHIWLVTTMDHLSDLEKDINVQWKTSYTKVELTTIMSQSEIYISMTHGDDFTTETGIFIDSTDKSVVLKTSDIYNKEANVAMVDLSNCELMIFLACEAAKGNNSICNAVVLAGADYAIGFEESILVVDATEWLDKFFYYYKQYYNGVTYLIEDCCDDAFENGFYTESYTIETYKVFSN